VIILLGMSSGQQGDVGEKETNKTSIISQFTGINANEINYPNNYWISILSGILRRHRKQGMCA
jgi:hypothetical protein